MNWTSSEPTQVKFEKLDVAGIEDKRLLMQSVARLWMGVQPLSQWAPVFSNPDLLHLPGLRCKAFTVWFPTLIDFIGMGAPELAQLRTAILERGLESDRLFEVAREFETHASALLCRFTKDEQLFLNDRRLQNVHGVVSQFFRPTVGVRWYSSEDRIVLHERLPDDDYHDIMRQFYGDMQRSTLVLLERCVTSREWIELGALVQGDASMERIERLARQLGVGR